MKPAAEGLVLHAPAVEPPHTGPASPVHERCTLCGGPPRLCGGSLRCTGAVGSPNELRWLTGIRAVYGGLLLTPTPAALWGGSLLRMGRLLVAGTTAPASIAEVAAERAPLSTAAAPDTLPASLAIAYLEHEDLDRLWDLREGLELALGEGRLSPWLDDLLVGVRAALATPLDVARVFSLFAARCKACWGKEGHGPRPSLFEHVDTYDRAIRCPGCGEVPPHPLPGVTVGAPHPVGRCVGGARGARSACMSHPGYELDREGLCVEGRAVLERATSEATAMARKQRAMDPALVEAVAKAQALAQKAQADARMKAMGNHMEQFIAPFLGRTQPLEAGEIDGVMTSFGEHVTAVVGDGFERGVERLFASLKLDKLLSTKKRGRRKKKVRRLGTGGAR